MKNKGFTLVELLGVIVVLAIIVLIAVPTIIGVIDKSRKNSLQNSGYGLIEAGTLYNAQYQNTKTIRFDIKNNEVTSEEENKLKYKGNIKEGTVLINKTGEVVVCINDGKYAAYKNFKDNKVTIVDNKTCTVPENSSIVYLDNEATVDTNIEDLVSRIETLEQNLENQNKIIENQNKEIEELKLEITNQNDIKTSITNLNNTHNTDMTLLNNKLGNTDISSIGNTVTGAIASLNNNLNNELVYRKNLYSYHVNEPWYAIKESWSEIQSGGVSFGRINGGREYGYIFDKTDDKYGSGLIFGYVSGAVYHIYVDYGNFSLENISVNNLTTF